jgi:hypothetical protein
VGLEVGGEFLVPLAGLLALAADCQVLLRGLGVAVGF